MSIKNQNNENKSNLEFKEKKINEGNEFIHSFEIREPQDNLEQDESFKPEILSQH